MFIFNCPRIIVITAFFDPGVAHSGGRATAVGAARRDQSNGQRGGVFFVKEQQSTDTDTLKNWGPTQPYETSTAARLHGIMFS